MGLVSSDLQNIVNQLDKAKNSINNKYDIMRNNNANAQEDISHLYIDELSPSIDKIECLNSYDSELEPNKILEGTKFYSKGQPLIGTMPNNETQNIILDVDHISEGIALGYHNGTGTANIILQEKECIPGISDQNITPDTNKVLSKVTVKGDSNLSSENIKPGVSIFNVTGSGEIKQLNSLLYEEKSELKIPSGWYQDSEVKIQTQEKTCKPNNTLQIIEPDDEHVLSRVFVEGDEDLIPENIKKGVNIFGIVGNMKEYSDYNIVYVANQSKHIAYKQKVAHDKNFNIISDIPISLYGEEFKGWSADPAAITPTYTSGQQISTSLADIGETAILYAVWEFKLGDIILELSYSNDGKLDSNNIETVNVKIISNEKITDKIIKTYEINGYKSIQEYVNSDDYSYTHKLTFNKVGIYPIIVKHTSPNGEYKIANGVIKILDSGGSMRGSGVMDIVTDVCSYYDSKWIDANIIKGCYIQSFNFHFALPKNTVSSVGDHRSGNNDSFAILGKNSNGKVVLLYDFGSTQHLMQEVTSMENIDNPTNNKDNNHVINVGSYDLTKGELGSLPYGSEYDHNISNTYNKNDDIRQIRFFVYSNHGMDCAFSIAEINYDISYEFDIDLYESDENR